MFESCRPWETIVLLSWKKKLQRLFPILAFFSFLFATTVLFYYPDSLVNSSFKIFVNIGSSSHEHSRKKLNGSLLSDNLTNDSLLSDNTTNSSLPSDNNQSNYNVEAVSPDSVLILNDTSTNDISTKDNSLDKNVTNNFSVPITTTTVSHGIVGILNLSLNNSQDIVTTTTTEKFLLSNVSSWTNVTTMVTPNSNLTFPINESVVGFKTNEESNNNQMLPINVPVREANNSSTTNSPNTLNSTEIATVNISSNVQNSTDNYPAESGYNISAITFNFNVSVDSVSNTSKPEKLFVIVAYRNREANKNVFVPVMNSYLTRKECKFTYS